MRPIILIHCFGERAAPLEEAVHKYLHAGGYRVVCDFTQAWWDLYGGSDVVRLKTQLWGQQVVWPHALLVDVAVYTEDRHGRPLEKAAETIVRLARIPDRSVI